MKRKFLSKAFAVFIILSMSAGQSGAMISSFASEQVQINKSVLLSKTHAGGETGQVGGDKKEAETDLKKDNLSEPKKKLGTDLLKLIDSTQLLPGESRAQIVSRMKEEKQYASKTDPVYLEEVNTSRGDLVNVYISVNPGISIDIINSYVWKISGKSEENHLAAALVETDKLESLASLPGVRSIKTVTPPHVRKGSAMAQGDAAHKTAQVRSAYEQQGAGVKIGVISDGANHASQAQKSGDLPSNLVILKDSGKGDEGTAMLEIIYDMAPGANLYFHGAGDNLLAFMSAYDTLAAAGCKVIIDDLGWDSDAWFEDGVVSAHLASLMKSKDVILVSAAGNEADRHYQGIYYDDGNDSNDFSRGSSDSKYLYATLKPDANINIAMQWNDKFGASGNDYDLALYKKSSNTKLAESNATQDGNDDPYECIDYTNKTSETVDVQIEVKKHKAASAKTLELFVYTDNISPTNIVAEDSIYGHPNTKGLITVGAVDSADSEWDNIEYFSSRGPSTFNGEGPRAKPEIVALDNVSVSGAGNFETSFGGTSASAPAVAAIVAQLWGAFPAMKGTQIRDAVLDSAVDLGTSGYDYTYGYGRADALRAYQLLAAEDSEKGVIASFTLGGKTGTVNESDRTITINLPAGTDLAALAPTIVVSGGATVSPKSGVVQDFTVSKTYTVASSNGTKQDYIIIVKIDAPTETEKTASQLPVGITNGDIIQCKDSPDPFAVYIVKLVGGKAYVRHIASLQIFDYYKHLKWENLKQVNSLESFALSGWIRAASGDKVWEVNSDQTKHWINMTAQQFLSHGGSDKAIFIVNQGELDLYKTGADVMNL